MRGSPRPINLAFPFRARLRGIHRRIHSDLGPQNMKERAGESILKLAELAVSPQVVAPLGLMLMAPGLLLRD